jgi:hypothetical protein
MATEQQTAKSKLIFKFLKIRCKNNDSNKNERIIRKLIIPILYSEIIGK